MLVITGITHAVCDNKSDYEHEIGAAIMSVAVWENTNLYLLEIYITIFFFTYSIKYTYLLGYLLILLRPSNAQYPSPFPGSSLRPLSRIRERTLGARLLHANSELQNQTYDYVFTAVNPNC